MSNASSSSSPNVTHLLVAWGKGDPQSFDRLMPQVQQELHRIAERYMAAERAGHDLQATALINEAYLRLVTGRTSSGPTARISSGWPPT